MLSWGAGVRADTAEYPPDVGGSFWAANTYSQFRDRAIDSCDRAGCRITMAESSSSALNQTLDTIGKCKGLANYREWGRQVRQAFGLYAREMLKSLTEHFALRRPTRMEWLPGRWQTTSIPSCSF